MKLHPAYVAGFFDGEGCVYGMRNMRFTKWQLTMSQNDRAPLEAILETFPGGTIKSHKAHPKFKSNGGYSLVYAGRRGIEFAEAILPFTIVKHDALSAYLDASLSNGISIGRNHPSSGNPLD